MKKTIPLLFLVSFALSLSFENFASSANVFNRIQPDYLKHKLERNLTYSVQRNVRIDTSTDSFSESQFIFASSKQDHANLNTTSKPNESKPNDSTPLEGGDQTTLGSLEGKPLLLIVLLLLGIVLLMAMIWLMDQQHSSGKSDSESTQKD